MLVFKLAAVEGVVFVVVSFLEGAREGSGDDGDAGSTGEIWGRNFLEVVLEEIQVDQLVDEEARAASALVHQESDVARVPLNVTGADGSRAMSAIVIDRTLDTIDFLIQREEGFLLGELKAAILVGDSAARAFEADGALH